MPTTFIKVGDRVVLRPDIWRTEMVGKSGFVKSFILDTNVVISTSLGFRAFVFDEVDLISRKQKGNA